MSGNTDSVQLPLSAMTSLAQMGVSPSSFLGPMLKAASEELAEEFDPSRSRMLIDAVVMSSEAQVLSSMFAAQPALGNPWSPVYGAAAYSYLGSTLAFLSPSGMWSFDDANKDHRLSVGELLDIAA